MKSDTVLMTFPVTKPQKQCLRLMAAGEERSIASFLRGAISEKLGQIRPDLAETWNCAAPKARSRQAA